MVDNPRVSPDDPTRPADAAGVGDALLGIPGLVDPEEIGRGGFGVVYRARQPELNRVVAVKVLPARLDAAGQERFAREGYAMGTVGGHPNIVQVLSVGTTAHGRPYLLMPLLAGGPLGARVPLRPAEAFGHAVKLCGALETAHRAGVLHRDVKPANVMLSAFGEPQLGDFGISRVTGGFETSEGVVSASMAYAAPEVLSGGAVGVPADVYSLAATLFCLLAGHPPFRPEPGEPLVTTYLRIARDPVPDLRPRGVPDALCSVLEAALAKEPAARPPSAMALGRRLQDAQRSAGWPVTPMALPAEALADAPEGLPEAVLVDPAPEVTPTATTVPSPPPVPTRPVEPAGPTRPMDPPAPAPATAEGRPRRGRRLAAAAVAAVVLATGGFVGLAQLGGGDGGEDTASAEATPDAAELRAHAAELDRPTAIVAAPDGTVYIADADQHRVQRVRGGTGDDPAVETYAGTGEGGYTGDEGPAAEAQLSYPTSLALAADGSLYVAGDGYVRRIGPDAVITTVTGFDDGTYLSVADMTMDGDGNLYVADSEDGEVFRIRRRDPGGAGTTFASGIPELRRIAGHPEGGLVASAGAFVLRLTGDGEPVRIAGTEADLPTEDDRPALETPLAEPGALAFDGEGRLHVAETSNGRVRRVEPDGRLRTVAGSPLGHAEGDDGDGGPARAATFTTIGPIAFDPAGNLSVGDEDADRVRVVDPSGTIRPFA